MTEAIVAALERALEADRARVPLADRVADIVDDLLAKARPGGRDMSRDEIDAMWGN